MFLNRGGRRLGSLRAGLLAAFVAAAGALALVGSAHAASAENAAAGSQSGKANVESGGKTTPVGATTKFSEGDILWVASGSRLTVTLADGATLALVGPTKLEFVELAPKGRRVRLHSGVISEAYTRGVAVEVQTPYDVSLVLQNATGFARVAPGTRVSFEYRDGDFAKIWMWGEQRYQELRGAWTMNVREGDPKTGDVATTARGDATRDMATLMIGDRPIAYGPQREFKVERTGDGGARLTYIGKDIGLVQIGSQCTLVFLAPGDSITFDGNGNVIQNDGISHIYHPFDDLLPYDEPVENAADASVSRPGRR